MVKEVSCRALDPFLRAADRRRIARSELCRGIDRQLASLEDKGERIDWDEFRRFLANVRIHFSEAEVVEIGAAGLRSPMVRSFVAIGRTLLSPEGFYRWVLSSGGLGDQLFSNVLSTFRELGPGQLAVDIRMAPGFAPCHEFHLMSLGGMRELPRLLGLDRARVEMLDLERGVRLVITLPETASTRSRLVKLLTRRSDARTAATDLEDALRSLERRYAELEEARVAAERQRTVLDVAYRMGHAIWREREPAAIGEAVARRLVATAGIAGACVEATDGRGAPVAIRHGEVSSGRKLEAALAGQHVRGHVEVWLADGVDADAAIALLGVLEPTLVLAFDNAYAYLALAAYQADLERLVDARTTELRRARDDLADTVVQLRDASATRERIFANISHEIRTPLALILLAVAEVEARAADLDPLARADLSRVVDSARKLLRLVDELLLLAAGQERSLGITRAPTDLAQLVTAVASAWRPAAADAGLSLAVDVPPSLVVDVDAVAMERVVTNLLSNAIKFTPAPGSVTLTLTRADGEARLAVRDTGIGIDDELLPRLFGRFERGRSGRSGSGIGLALVKALIEAHGGEVGTIRPPGGGTELWLRLPDRAPEAVTEVRAVVPALRASDYGVGSSPTRSGDVFRPDGPSIGTILVAEDDPALAAMIARLLAVEHTVVVALDGPAALELARQHEPHLLVTDIDLPGCDGLELTRRFREGTSERLAPVVILSAMADVGDRLAGFEAGAVDYVVKPFDPAELTARVRAQLGIRDLALRLHRAEQLSALGTLSAGMAHELRNPANAIANAVEPLRRLLSADYRDPSHPVAQLLEVLQGCAEQIGLLSRQLLGFRRGGALELSVVPLTDVVKRALVLAQPARYDVAVRLSIDVAEPVRCAPPMLVQVLTNLIENGAQAAGPGGWVEVAASAANGHLTIEVSDSGPGVPRALRDRVFEPFFTTKAPNVGTGVGLPLAREIVHRHHGVLEIRERDGRPCFVVELPRQST